jgi:hypothetical protein
MFNLKVTELLRNPLALVNPLFLRGESVFLQDDQNQYTHVIMTYDEYKDLTEELDRYKRIVSENVERLEVSGSLNE